MLDDLPNLDDLETPKQTPNNGMSMIPPSEVNRYQKFIRNNGISTPKQAGMGMESFQQPNPGQLPKMQAPPQYQPYESNRVYENFDMNLPIMYRNRGQNFPVRIPRYEEIQEYENNNLPRHKHFHEHDGNKHKHFHEHDGNKHKHSYSCVEVADHTSNCAVCSKLYSNNNTIFIFIIIFQAVILLLLLKRILETS